MDTKNFMTRTIFWERPNCFDGKNWVIGADIGYSGVKVMSPSHCICFPSYAVKQYYDHGVLTVNDDYILYTDLETGEKWLVGQYAYESISDRDTSIAEEALFSRDRYLDPMFLVLVRSAIGFGLMPGKVINREGCRVSIRTGYPPGYEEDKEDIVDAFAGHHHFSLTIGNQQPIEFNINIEKKQVDTMPQPLGTFFSVSVDNNGYPLQEMLAYRNGSVLVFDAGFGTLDLYRLSRGNIIGRNTSQNFGMRRVMQEACVKLEEQGIHMSVPAIQKHLEKGYVRYSTRRSARNVAFGDILEDASKRVCQEALDWTGQIYPFAEFDYLIITGGTSAAWADVIREYLSGFASLKVIDGNVSGAVPFIFANVRGYYLYGVYQVRAKNRKAENGANAGPGSPA